MIQAILNIIRRFRALQHVSLKGGGRFLSSPEVYFDLKEGAELSISNGTFSIGATLPQRYATHQNTVLAMGRNSRLVVHGDAVIAPGASIIIEDNATLTIGANVFIAHNLTLICAQQVEIGAGSSISWNVTLIDSDGHACQRPDGRVLRPLYKPLTIGSNVGIQMGVIIPRGVDIGSDAIISSGTVVRQDIPPMVHAYQENRMRIRKGRQMLSEAAL